MKVKYYPARDCFRLVVPARFSDESKRQAKYFKTKEEGEIEIRRILARGNAARPQLNERQSAILTLAENEGLSFDQIGEALRHYRATVLNVSKRIQLLDMAEAFIERQKHEDRMPRTIDDDRQRLNKFYNSFGNVDVCTLTEVGLRHYLEQYPPGGNRRSHYKTVRKFIRWAHQSGYLAIDLMARIRPLDKWGVNNDIIDVEDFRRLLFVTAGLESIVPGEQPTNKYLALLPYYVLGGLAGMRRAEMLRDRQSQQVIEWGDLNWAKDLIRVRNEVAKHTRAEDRRRWIPLEPAAREWLLMVAKPTGPIVDIYQSTHTKLSGELLKALDIDLPENGLRNSYASYAQTFRPLSDVAKACGDLEQTIKRFYTEALEPETGRAWFDVRPGLDAAKIVPISA